MLCKLNVEAFTTKLQALQIKVDKVKEKSSTQKHRHYIDTVYHQNQQKRNTKVFEKYSNCNQKKIGRQRDLPVRGAGYEPSASYACQKS